MSKPNGHDSAVKEESSDRFMSDLDELKTNFGELRKDVTRLLEHASETAKSGAGMLKDRARNLTQHGVESIEHAENRIAGRQLLSVALAAGIGFVMANVLLRRR